MTTYFLTLFTLSFTDPIILSYRASCGEPLQRGLFIATLCDFARRGFTHDVSIVRSLVRARART